MFLANVVMKSPHRNNLHKASEAHVRIKMSRDKIQTWNCYTLQWWVILGILFNDADDDEEGDSDDGGDNEDDNGTHFHYLHISIDAPWTWHVECNANALLVRRSRINMEISYHNITSTITKEYAVHGGWECTKCVHFVPLY